MNLSERIRSCLSSPKTAADVHSIIGGDLALIRGCIQTMVKVGLLQRIGETKPYRYQVARQLKPQKRGFYVSKISFAQQVRDLLKNGPIRPAQVASHFGVKIGKVTDSMKDSEASGFIKRLDDGSYKFVRDPAPKTTMSNDERKLRQAEYRKRKAESQGREYRSVPQRANGKRIDRQYTVIKPKEVAYAGNYESVEEWLKRGNVIDRSPTEHKFERLTKADIESGAARGFGGYQTPYSRRFSMIG